MPHSDKKTTPNLETRLQKSRGTPLDQKGICA